MHHHHELANLTFLSQAAIKISISQFSVLVSAVVARFYYYYYYYYSCRYFFFLRQILGFNGPIKIVSSLVL